MLLQNRQAARDRDEAEHDYEINREALALLKQLNEEQAKLKEFVVKIADRLR